VVAAVGAVLFVVISAFGAVFLGQLLGLSSRDAVPLTAVLAAVVGTVVTAGLTVRNAADERIHAREMASEARKWERRADAYVAAVTHFNLVREAVDRALPMTGEHEMLYRKMGEERLEQLRELTRGIDAQVLAFGSTAMKLKVFGLQNREALFWTYVARYERYLARGHEIKADQEEENAVEARNAFRESFFELRELVTVELGERGDPSRRARLVGEKPNGTV